MKDEIKEILDRLERIDHKEYSGGFEFADSGSFDEDCRCFEERKKLANYITNLQEIADVYNRKYREVKMLKEQLLYEKENTKVYKSRIENAIEYINNNSYFADNIVKTMVFKDYSSILLNILQGVGKDE